MTNEHVSASPPASCKADLTKYCRPGAAPQSEAMYYGAARPALPAPPPGPPFTNCSVFGCTCKGAADYYGINGGFGCAPVGAQHWWIHEAKPCAGKGSCCVAGDYTKNPPPYPGCSAPKPPPAPPPPPGPPAPAKPPPADLVAFLLIRGDYGARTAALPPPAPVAASHRLPHRTDFSAEQSVCLSNVLPSHAAPCPALPACCRRCCAAWYGHGWQGCGQPPADAGGGYPFPPELHADFGAPLGLCAETAPGSGVYSRKYSRATITMDCNTAVPRIEMVED